MTVRAARIGDILELRRQPVTIDPEAEYRRIGIYSWGKGFLHRPPAPGTEMGSLRYFTFPEGALVLSNIQAWEAAVAVSGPAEHSYLASNRFLPYVPRSESEVNVQYLLHYFLSEDGLAALRRASPGTQVRNRTLGQKLFEAAHVPLPEVEEQIRISSYLNRVGFLSIKTITSSAMITRLRSKLIEQEVSKYPARRTRLGDILTQRVGEPVLPESIYPISGVYSFGRGLLKRETLRGTETKYPTMTRLSRGDVVYSKLGAFECAVAVVDDLHRDRFVSPEFPVFEVDIEVEPKYLRYCLMTNEFAAKMQDASTGIGARQKRVHPAAFQSIDVPLPETDIQRRIAELLEKLDRVHNLSQIRKQVADAMLPAARNEVFSSLR